VLILSFKIGDIELDNPVILAPMAGVTDLPFRHMVRKYGADLIFTEMMASKVTINANIKKKRRDYVDFFDEAPIAVQLIGYDADMIAESAKIVTDKGASLIDINFGCPAKKLVNKYCGAALMKDEKLATEIIEKTVKATNKPVSVKMRLGWDNDNLNALNICKIAENSGAEMVTIHGRTREQLFTGKANWQAIGEIKDKIRIPVIANGDITSPETAKIALKQSGADGIMIARGIYGKPWLIKQTIEFLKKGEIKTHLSEKEIIEDTIEHYKLIIEHYGERVGTNIARKHLSWYLNNIKNSEDIIYKIKRLKTSEEVIDLLDSYKAILF